MVMIAMDMVTTELDGTWSAEHNQTMKLFHITFVLPSCASISVLSSPCLHLCALSSRPLRATCLAVPAAPSPSPFAWVTSHLHTLHHRRRRLTSTLPQLLRRVITTSHTLPPSGCLLPIPLPRANISAHGLSDRRLWAIRTSMRSSSKLDAPPSVPLIAPTILCRLDYETAHGFWVL